MQWNYHYFFLLIIIHTSERPYILVEWSFQTRKNSQYLLVGDHAKITLIVKKIVLCVQYVKFNFLPILILSGIKEKQNETPHVPSHGSDLYHLDKVLISWSQSPVSFLLLEERFMLSFPQCDLFSINLVQYFGKSYLSNQYSWKFQTSNLDSARALLLKDKLHGTALVCSWFTADIGSVQIRFGFSTDGLAVQRCQAAKS